MTDYVIETKALTKCYHLATALKQVNIHVKKGSIYGLIGDNGAGKTTLLKLLAGHSFATEGEIYLFGRHKENELRNARRKTGCMIEHPGFFPNMTVQQTLEYYRIQKGIPDKNRILEMLSLTELTEKRKSRCKNLSLGQKQRLGLAIALMGDPQLLILDEPVNGLDPSGIVSVRNLLHRLNQEKNITILISSHILSELQQLATAYGFLNKGTLLEEISADKLAEKCSDYLEITVTDIERFSVVLEKFFPEENFTVLPENTLRIFHPRKEPEAYSRAAFENQIFVTKMNPVQSSLEDYYIELKRRGTL